MNGSKPVSVIMLRFQGIIIDFEIIYDIYSNRNTEPVIDEVIINCNSLTMIISHPCIF